MAWKWHQPCPGALQGMRHGKLRRLTREALQAWREDRGGPWKTMRDETIQTIHCAV